LQLTARSNPGGLKMVQASDQPQSAQSAQSFFVLTEQVIGAAIEVHRHLGPGMLESAYEACLTQEIQNAGLLVERQKALPILYEGQRLDVGYRLDLVVERALIVELKSVERLDRVHLPQMKDGIRRVANALPK
jgi:GxxExxY protein